MTSDLNILCDSKLLLSYLLSLLSKKCQHIMSVSCLLNLIGSTGSYSHLVYFKIFY
jgi:hypothetical protein